MRIELVGERADPPLACGVGAAFVAKDAKTPTKAPWLPRTPGKQIRFLVSAFFVARCTPNAVFVPWEANSRLRFRDMVSRRALARLS
jgi:hypothetical protein